MVWIEEKNREDGQWRQVNTPRKVGQTYKDEKIQKMLKMLRKAVVREEVGYR